MELCRETETWFRKRLLFFGYWRGVKSLRATSCSDGRNVRGQFGMEREQTTDWQRMREQGVVQNAVCAAEINHSTQIIKQTLVEGVSRTKDKLGLNPRGKTCGEATWGSNGQNVHPPQRHPYAPAWAVNPGRQSRGCWSHHRRGHVCSSASPRPQRPERSQTEPFAKQRASSVKWPPLRKTRRESKQQVGVRD